MWRYVYERRGIDIDADHAQTELLAGNVKRQRNVIRQNSRIRAREEVIRETVEQIIQAGAGFRDRTDKRVSEIRSLPVVKRSYPSLTPQWLCFSDKQARRRTVSIIEE